MFSKDPDNNIRHDCDYKEKKGKQPNSRRGENMMIDPVSGEVEGNPDIRFYTFSQC